MPRPIGDRLGQARAQRGSCACHLAPQRLLLQPRGGQGAGLRVAVRLSPGCVVARFSGFSDVHVFLCGGEGPLRPLVGGLGLLHVQVQRASIKPAGPPPEAGGGVLCLLGGLARRRRRLTRASRLRGVRLLPQRQRREHRAPLPFGARLTGVSLACLVERRQQGHEAGAGVEEEVLLRDVGRSLLELLAEPLEVRRHLVRLLRIEGDVEVEADELLIRPEPERLVGAALPRVHLELVAEELGVEADSLEVLGPAARRVLREGLQLRSFLPQPVEPLSEGVEAADRRVAQTLHREVVETNRSRDDERKELTTKFGGVAAPLAVLPRQHLADDPSPGGTPPEQPLLGGRLDVPLGDDEGEVVRLDVILEVAGPPLGAGAQELAALGAEQGVEQVEDRALSASVAEPEHRVRAAAVAAAGAQVEGEGRQSGVGVAHGREVDAKEARHQGSAREMEETSRNAS